VKRLVFAALLCGAMLAAGQTPDPNGPRQRPGTGKSDWERAHESADTSEAEVALPVLPKADLVEFFVSGASSFKFFIDPHSISAGPDGVVRYTLVARSRSGTDNVSYEGIRCESGTYKVYAIGSNGRWSATQNDWRKIEPRSVQRWHNELYLRYFCVDGVIIRSPEEGADALRRGARRDVNNSERAN
jgi:CNP1-like family protein